MWCCLYIANAIGMLTRGQDKRVYYVKQNVEAIPLKSKKGLGGLINHEFLASDLDELGISTFTVDQGWDVIPYSDLYGAKSLSDIAINPSNQNQVYVTSYFSGLPIGFFCAYGLNLLLDSTLGSTAMQAWGWRIPFLCSAVLVIIGLYVRLRMTETPIFRKAVEQDRVVKHPLRSLLPYWKEVLLGTFAMGITYSLFYVLGTWSLSYAVKVMKPPFSQNEYLAMQMVSVVFFAIFIFVTCIYSDKLGRKTVLISTTLATLVFSLYAMQSLQHNVLTVMLFLCVGFALMGGLFGPCGAYLPELFPTHVRYSGAGLSYNLAAILGGAFAPAISTALVKSTGAVESVGWYLAVMSLLALIALFLIKESKDEDYEK